MTSNKKRSGFTLIELLVVIAILATIGGALLVSYDGLEVDAAQAQATYNINAVDRAVRTFRTLNKGYPDELDSLLFSASGAGTDSTALNLLPSKIKGKIGPHVLTAQGAAALSAVGITRTRFVSGALASTYDNGSPGTQPSIPNRVFDNATRGWGVVQPVAAGLRVAAIETSNNGGGVSAITAFTAGGPPVDSNRLRDIAGLDENLLHVVVVFGLGNNSTIVAGANTQGTSGTLSEAPYYTNILRNEYGRFLLLYHLGTDSDDDGTLEANEYFSEAKFVAVIDTKGDWLDEEYAEFTNQKQ